MPPIRALCVSNFDLMCAGYTDIMQSSGTIVVVGESRVNDQVVDLARTLKPDVLVVDVSDNDVETLALFTAVRDALPQVGIIALADEKNSAFALRALHCGVYGYLTHGEAVRELVDAITTVAQNQLYLGPMASSALVRGYRAKARARKQMDAGPCA